MKFSRFLLLATALVAATPVFAQQQQPQGVGANYETRLTSLEDELRALNGQVEQLGFSIRRLDQTLQRLQTDYDARITKLEVTVGTLQAAADARAAAPPPAQTQTTTQGTLGALKQRDGRVTDAVNAPQAPLLPEASEQDTMTPQEQYDHALSLLRQADYETAESEFKDFIDHNPKNKMLDNAKYWHAETLYVRGKFADAAVGFADAFQQNQQGNKAPDSLLKLAMSLGATNKTSDACTALAALKTKYPNASSNVKTRAAEQRTKLKCSS